MWLTSRLQPCKAGRAIYQMLLRDILQGIVLMFAIEHHTTLFPGFCTWLFKVRDVPSSQKPAVDGAMLKRACTCVDKNSFATHARVLHVAGIRFESNVS